MSGTRHSARIKAITTVTLSEAQDITSDREKEDAPDTPSDDQESSHQKQSSGKKGDAPMKAKDAPTAKKKRRGKLRKMPDMPLDILFEIFRHLVPYDLLRLSRATKSLRQILMRRSSAFAWKRARTNVPSLPECPAGLSEPAYANLAFDPHCYFCGAPGANHMTWSLFKRACKGCHKTKYFHCYNPETLESLCDRLGIPPDRAFDHMDIGCLPCVRDCIFVLEDLKPVLLEYGAIKDKGQRAEWKETKAAEKMERSIFATAAYHWFQNWKKQRLNEIGGAKERRSAAILDQLRNDGWGDIIDKFTWKEKSEFERHRLVNQSKDLTERIWKNIKPQMTELFETFRTRQRAQNILDVQVVRLGTFTRAFEIYCASLPFDAIMLPMGNILTLDSVRAIIFDDRTDLEVDESAFQEAFSTVPGFAALWKARFNLHLYQLLASSAEEAISANASPDIPMFDLATSLFCCSKCDCCHLTYKQALSHRCTDWSLSASMSAYSALFHRYPKINHFLNETKFTLCSHRAQMKALLKACGLAENATMNALQDVNPLVECQVFTCEVRIHGRHAMYWHEWLSHCAQTEDVRILTRSDLIGKMFQPPGMVAFYDNASAGRLLYGCKHCYSPRCMPFMALKDHLSTVHHIEIESRASIEHYVIHPAVPPYELCYSVLYEQG